MAQPTTTQQMIAADESDLKNNRLGLMSQRQIDSLQSSINDYTANTNRTVQRSIAIGIVVTIGIVILLFVRVLLFPIAALIEAIVIGGMIFLTTDLNRFVHHLTIDKESGAVRIIKGRVSRYTMRSHPMYQTLRVEVQNYKLIDESVHKQFENGELYQLYVLPQSKVIIAAEKISEAGAGYLR